MAGIQTGLTDAQLLASQLKAHELTGMSSSASEIDNTIENNKKYIVPQGLNETDDMTSIIQSYIDTQNLIYLSRDERLSATTTIHIPYGKYKIEGLHIKSGVKLDMNGIFIPLNADSECVFISGSYIEIGTLNISARNIVGFVGKLLLIDSTNTLTLDYLDNYSKMTSIKFININTLNIMGANSNNYKEYGIYIKSSSLAKGISWIMISNMLIRNCYFGLYAESATKGYINSCTFEGFITSCVKSIYLNANTGEIASDYFNAHIQTRGTSEDNAITSLLAGNNTYDGIIWDWLESYGDIIYDTGIKNKYKHGLVSGSWFHKVKLLGETSIFEDVYESNTDRFYNLFHWNENSRNGIGFQDNLLAFANKRFTVSVTPSKSASIDKIFKQATGINHYANTPWPSENGGGEIVYTITNIPQCRMYSLSVGFTKQERIARGIKLEIKLSTGGWITIDNITNNINTVYTYRANGGSGYDIDSIRLTFSNGASVKDGVIGTPLSNQLSIQSMVMFGAGERKSFLPYYEASFSNFISVESSTIPNNSMFVDSADGKMKFKDSVGTVNILY